MINITNEEKIQKVFSEYFELLDRAYNYIISDIPNDTDVIDEMCADIRQHMEWFCMDTEEEE